MANYIDTCRWFIRLRPIKCAVDRKPSEIYEGTGDSYDMPEPYIIDNIMRVKSNCIHFELMLAVF